MPPRPTRPSPRAPAAGATRASAPSPPRPARILRAELTAHDHTGPRCHFSPCRRWRYWLTRTWDPAQAPLVVIGLNPSTADEHVDDHTVRRVVRFAARWGHGGLVMLNAFAWRSTDPKGLVALGVEPIGAENDATLVAQCRGRRVLCAWGVHGTLHDRGAQVLSLIQPVAREVVCLGTTKDGHPRHPLYLASALTPTPFPPRRAAP